MAVYKTVKGANGEYFLERSGYYWYNATLIPPRYSGLYLCRHLGKNDVEVSVGVYLYQSTTKCWLQATKQRRHKRLTANVTVWETHGPIKEGT